MINQRGPEKWATKSSRHKTTPSLFRNYLSLGAAAVALACLASILLLFLVEITGRRSSPYIGIFAWVILPAILVLSLIVILLGAVRERRHRRELSRAGVTTLSDYRFKRSAAPENLSGFRSGRCGFRGNQRLREFSGLRGYGDKCILWKTCHTVMKPELVAFQNSPTPVCTALIVTLDRGQNRTCVPNSTVFTNSTR